MPSHRTTIITPYGSFTRRGRTEYIALSVYVVNGPSLTCDGIHYGCGNYAPVWHRKVEQVVAPTSIPWGEYVGTWGVGDKKMRWSFVARTNRWTLGEMKG